MTLERIEPGPEAWDRFVGARGGHLLQTSRWGALKRDFGWQDEIVAIGHDGQIAAGALVLYRRLPLRLGTIAYVPRGPVVGWEDGETVAALLKHVDAAAKQRAAALLKVEPGVWESAAVRERLAALSFRELAQTVQPPRTIVIDLTGSEDDILMHMSQTTRRKVRVAAKKEVTVRRGGAADLDAFNRLMGVTGARNEFGVHSDAYYRRVWELFGGERAALLMASYQGQDLAGLFVFAQGETATYLYGASSDAERSRMPAYALQWEAMRWARERGCVRYDLWGVPDEDEAALEAQFQQRDDGLWGVYGFKRGFGGEVRRTVGAWDRVYRPALYAAYRVAIALRRGGLA